MNPFRLVSRVVAAPPPAEWPRAAAPLGHAQHRGAADAPERRAYAVPWRVVHREASGIVELVHAGDQAARAVRASFAGQGMLGLTLPRTVHPGERVRLVFRGSAAEAGLSAPDAMLVVRWFDPDGTELLWPIAL